MGLSKRLRWLGVAACAVAVGFMVIRLQGERPTPGLTQPSLAAEPRSSVSDAVLVDVEEGRVQTARSVAAPASPATVVESANSSPTERWLRGRVLLADGLPAKKATVALIEWGDDLSPVSHGKNARVRTDGLGRFELSVPGWAWGQTAYLSARRGGSRPYSGTILIGEAELAKSHELHLGKGHAIEGRVLLRGEPLAKVYVGVDVAYGVPGFQGAGQETWWIDSRMEEKWAETTTDEDGYFRVSGLSAAEHRVYLHESAAPPSRIAAHLYAVMAPDTRVYDLTAATLRLVANSSIGALVGAQITVKLDYTKLDVTSARTPVEVEVPPGQAVRLVVEHPLAARLEQEVVAPGAGQRLEVALPMQLVERPRLLVNVSGAEADSLLFHLSPCAGGEGLVVKGALSKWDEAFVVDAVPLEPGPYYLSIEPGPSGTARGFHYTSSCELDLPAAGDVHAILPLSRGGRCEVEVLSESGFESSASYELIDGEGRVCMARTVSAEFVEMSGDGDFEEGFVEVEVSVSSSSFFDGAVVDREHHERRRASERGVLLPGAYTLNVTSEGFQPWTREVEVTAGHVTKVEAWLEEKK